MTNRATLEALLARVLQGTGPDRELDGEIEAYLTGRVTHPRAPGWTFEPQDVEWQLARLANSPFISQARRPAPPYTASLDAALTLVPEGWRWWVNSSGYARLWLPGKDGQAPQAIAYCEQRATPPRALIAACLRARMEVQLSSDT